MLVCYPCIQLDCMLMVPSAADSDQGSVSLGSLQSQNKERAYRQKLQVYHEAQQRQAQLVQKLQAKVRDGDGPQDSAIIPYEENHILIA